MSSEKQTDPKSYFWAYAGQGVGIFFAALGLVAAIWACKGFPVFWG